MLWKDARFALRLLVRSPGFAVTLLALLALGIGAVTAMFSITHALLVAPLPYQRATDLTMVWVKRPVGNGSPASLADFVDWKEQGTAIFDRLTAVEATVTTLAPVNAPAQQIRRANVTGDFFPMFSLTAQRGRLLTPEDDVVDARPVVVVSDTLWRSQYGADPNLIGQSITLSGRPYTVVGIAPPGFRFASVWSIGVDLWTPIAVARKTYSEERTNRGRGYYLLVMGRRQPGVSLAQAQSALAAIAKQQEIAYPETNASAGVRLVDLQEAVVGWTKERVSVMFAAVALVFATICANIAGLLLTRGQARRGEMAARAALGATRTRLVVQVLTETVFIFLIGGAAGMATAYLLLDFFAANVLGTAASRLFPMRLNGSAFGFCIGIAIATGILSGLGPALSIARVQPLVVLKETSAGAGMSRRQRVFGSGLVAVQIALSFVLLAGAGSMVRGFVRAAQKPPGFVPENLVTARVAIVGEAYDKDDQRITYFDTLFAAIAAQPDVESVAGNGTMPMSGDNEDSFVRAEGKPAPPPGTGDYMTRNLITPGYFKTMGIPLLRGREFTAADNASARPLIIISDRTARELFPNEDPIGRRVAWVGAGAEPKTEWREIIGVVGDVYRYGLLDSVPLEGYLPFAQAPQRRMHLAIRTKQPDAIIAALPRVARSVDSTQAIADPAPMTTYVDRSLSPLRDSALLVSMFAAMSLLLATLGVFGLTSYATSRRTRELGLRMALGSSPERILGLVLSGSLRVVVIGLTIGLIAAVFVVRSLSGIPEVGAPEPTVFAAIAIVLGVAASIACVVPAWTAIRISPAVALRYE